MTTMIEPEDVPTDFEGREFQTQECPHKLINTM